MYSCVLLSLLSSYIYGRGELTSEYSNSVNWVRVRLRVGVRVPVRVRVRPLVRKRA